MFREPRLNNLQVILYSNDAIFGGMRCADSYSTQFAITGLSTISISRAVWIGAIGRLYNGLATIRTKAVFNAKGQLVFKAYASGRYAGRWNTATNNGSIIGWYGLLRGGL